MFVSGAVTATEPEIFSIYWEIVRDTEYNYLKNN
jgi:hypothetical protein